MPGTRVRVQKATTLLRKEHEILEGLFTLYEKLGAEAEPARKLRLFGEIRFRLLSHAVAENEIFYPAVERSGEAAAEDAVVDALEEHQAVTSLMEELDEIDPADRLFDAKMRVLRENVESHARQEESVLFRCFDRLPRDERDEASRALKERLEELEGPQE